MSGLCIALPAHGGIVSEKTTLGLFNLGKLLVRNNIDHGLLTITNSSLITQCRSKCANFFVNNTQFDHLFFLDSDIGFQPESVLKLLQYNMDIVSATYPMKIYPTRYPVTIKQPEERRGDLIKINGDGMGFVMIHRRVFQDIAKQYPGLRYMPCDKSSDTPSTDAEKANSFHFFAELKNDDGYMSEDKAFFRRAENVGYDVWMDTTIQLTHTGYHIYGAE